MSLIAHTSNFSYSILVGDILMTSNVVDEEVKLPTFLKSVNSMLPIGQTLFPLRLRQKIYVVEENIAIALAGYESEMKIFLEDIKTNFKFRSCTIENFETFLKDYNFNAIANSAGYIIFAEKRPEGILLHPATFGQWQNSPSNSFEYVSACGSGSRDYIKEATGTVYYVNDGDANLLNRSISNNYILLCRLLGQERLTLNTIKKYWGAGFEMIYYDGQKFKKMDDITFVIWKGKVDLESENYDVSPFLFLNYRYFDEILFINAFSDDKLEAYIVPPIDIRKEDIDYSIFPKKPHFDSKKICCTYVLELSNGKISTPSLFAESDEKPGIISVDFDEQGHLRIMIQQQVQDFLIANLKQLVAENKVK